MKEKKYVYRSAVTGKFVTAQFAKRHPKTTVRERFLVDKLRNSRWLIKDER